MADTQSDTYRRNLSQAQTFVEAAGDLLLYCRFACPDQPFHGHAAEDWGNYPYGTLGVHLANMAAEAALLAPAEVADFLQRLIVAFPELRQVRPPLMPMDAPRSQSDGPIAGVLLDEIQRHVGQWRGNGGAAILTKAYRLEPPHPEAIQLARQIRPRFDTSRGAFEVLAPGRFDRQAAARGDFPFRLALPGQVQPTPNVLIGVDVSSSIA